MAIKLRPYQKECVEAIKSLNAQGYHRQLICLPTGSGKTVVFSTFIKESGSRALIIAHTQELLKQARDSILMMYPNITVGLVDENNKEFSAQVVIASIQSASIESNLKRLKEQDFPLLIIDECHHSATDGARKVLDYLDFGKNTRKLLVGFTATAYRQDNKGLGEVFDTITFELTTKELIEKGYLCPPKGFKIATNIDLSKVKSADGDFHKSSLSAVMDTPEINALVVESYKEKALGLPTICFGVTIQHAQNLVDEFNAHGITAKLIDGTMPSKERDSIIADYKEGKIQVLCNCQLLTEGVDLPSTSCVIIARPTKSKGLYTQMLGRGLRLYLNKKECIVIDFSEKNHTIDNPAILLDDVIEIKQLDEIRRGLFCSLPKNLAPELKAAIVSHDPLGRSFTWERTKDGNYFIRGGNQAYLEIQKKNAQKEAYRIIFCDGKKITIVADNLPFGWSCSTAEDFALENRSLFIISDREAPWRYEPISNEQRNLMKKHGFKKGINKLTKGQASDIIQSRVLFRGHP